MLRRTFVSVAALAPVISRRAMAQGPAVPAEIEAGKLLLGLLIPAALQKVKEWFEERPKKDLAKEKVQALYNALRTLGNNRSLFVNALKDYLSSLRAGIMDRDKERKASEIAVFMMRNLERLSDAVQDLGTGLEVVAPNVRDGINTYVNSRALTIYQISFLEKMKPTERAAFEQRLDETNKLFVDAIEGLRKYMATNYKLEDLIK